MTYPGVKVGRRRAVVRMRIRGPKNLGKIRVSQVYSQLEKAMKSGAEERKLPDQYFFLENEFTQEQLPVWDWPNDFISFSV